MKKEGSPENGILKWMVVEILIARLIYKHTRTREKVLNPSGKKDSCCTGKRITRVPWFHIVKG